MKDLQLIPNSASWFSPSASYLMHRAHLAAIVLEIFPLSLVGAYPTRLAWNMSPYLGVLCLVLMALKSAFSAPRIWTVEAGYLARFMILPA